MESIGTTDISCTAQCDRSMRGTEVYLDPRAPAMLLVVVWSPSAGYQCFLTVYKIARSGSRVKCLRRPGCGQSWTTSKSSSFRLQKEAGVMMARA